MWERFYVWLKKVKSEEATAIERLCEAEAKRKRLTDKYIAENRDQFRREIAYELEAQTTLCLELQREAGIV